MAHLMNVCILVPELQDLVSQEILSGIISESYKMNIGLTIVTEGDLKSDNYKLLDHLSNFTDLFKTIKVHGIIILAGSMSNLATSKELVEFIDLLPKEVPKINISLKIPGYPSVICNNVEPVKKIVDHLINHHGKKRFMFIKGPENQKEADDRFLGFKMALEENNLEINESYIFPGNFSPHSGAESIKKIIKNKMELPDAIICSDDDTALGVYSELKRNKIDILSNNIAVTGFDNLGFTRSMKPALTTVDQMFSNQGKLALEYLCILVNGGKVNENEFEPYVIFRESCGCHISEYEILNSKKTLKEYLYSSIDEIKIEGLENHISEINELLNSFLNNENVSLAKKIEGYISMYKYKKYNLKVLYEIITQLSHKIVEKLSKNRLIELYKEIEIINTLLITTISNEKIDDSRRLFEQNNELDKLLMHLSGAMSYNEFTKTIERNLFYLGIKGLSFVFNETKSKYLQEISQRKFEKDDSFNRSKKNYCTLYIPIQTKSDKGYCIFEILQESFHIAETISYQISRSLYIIELIEGLNSQLNEIERSYADLRTTKDTLLENEQLANIGGLVAGFTHEISNPIGVSVTANSHLLDELNKFNEAYNHGSLKKSELGDFINTAFETINILNSNLSRTSALINGFKQISVDQASDVKREFEMKSYVNEIAISLKPILRRGGHRIETDIDPELILNSYPGVFSQIITNLVQNSVKHGFEKIENGIITISMKIMNNKVLFIYSDNGCGIDKKNYEYIFQRYYSTKLGRGGTGLGLSIIKSLVEDKLLGSVKFDKEYTNGVRFTFELPILK